METANAAGAPPKVSSGRVYILTLNPATAKMLREIPAQAHAAVGAAGIAAVASAIRDAARQTRKRADAAGSPRSTNRSDSHPPAKPPAPANTGGTHAYHAACTWVRPWTSTRYSVVHWNQR